MKRILLLVALSFILLSKSVVSQTTCPAINLSDGARYGLKQFIHDKQEPFTEYLTFPVPQNTKIYFQEFRLVNSVNEKLGSFAYSSEKNQYVNNNSKEGGAVINLGYLGVEPNDNINSATEILVKPSLQNKNVTTLIKDVLSYRPQLFFQLVPSGKVTLLHYDLNKLPKLRKDLSDNLNTLHSANFYLLCPSFQLKQFIENIWGKATSELPFTMPVVTKQRTLAVVGFDQKLKLRYTEYPKNGQQLPPKELKSSIPLLTTPALSKITIPKIFGYNIVLKGQPDTTQWLSDPFEFNPLLTDKDTIIIKKIPDYNFVYIDISKIHNSQTLIQKLDSLSKSKGGIYFFLSNGNNPEVATNLEEYESMRSQLAYMQTDAPPISEDIKKIKSRELKQLDLKRISARSGICFTFFLSESSLYSLKSFSQLYSDIGTPSVIKKIIYTDEPESGFQVPGEYELFNL
jgi:hypothetical protein